MRLFEKSKSLVRFCGYETSNLYWQFTYSEKNIETDGYAFGKIRVKSTHPKKEGTVGIWGKTNRVIDLILNLVIGMKFCYIYGINDK